MGTPRAAAIDARSGRVGGPLRRRDRRRPGAPGRGDDPDDCHRDHGGYVRRRRGAVACPCEGGAGGAEGMDPHRHVTRAHGPLGPVSARVPGLALAHEDLAGGHGLRERARQRPGSGAGPGAQDRPVRRIPHALGSMLFIGSLILFLWLSGTWAAGSGAIRSRALTLLACASFVVLVGGTGLYLVSQAPCRVCGPARMDPRWRRLGRVRPRAAPGPREGIGDLGDRSSRYSPVAPLGFIFAAWCRRPVEPIALRRPVAPLEHSPLRTLRDRRRDAGVGAADARAGGSWGPRSASSG